MDMESQLRSKAKLHQCVSTVDSLSITASPKVLCPTKGSSPYPLLIQKVKAKEYN